MALFLLSDKSTIDSFTEAYETYNRGDAITDGQLVLLRRTFEQLNTILDALGPKWDLARREAIQRYNDFDRITRMREVGRKEGWYPYAKG